MTDKVKQLFPAKKETVEELMKRVLDEMPEEQKEMIAHSAVLILETDYGVGYFNMIRTTLFHVIGLIEAAKVFFVDELSQHQDPN